MNAVGKGCRHREDGVWNACSADILALALKTTSDGIWVWQVPTGEAYFSPRYYTMLGYAPDAFPASYDRWVSLVHPDDLDHTCTAIQQNLEAGKDGYEVEFRLRTQSGSWLWVLGRGRVVERDDGGRPLHVIGSHVNIDTRKRAERKLAEYHEQLEMRVRDRTRELEQTTSLLEATFNAIPDILGVQDDQHRIIRFNAAGYRLLNMTPDDVVGKRCYELIGRKDECDRCATSVCYRTKQPASVERYEEALSAWLDVRAYPILDDQGKVVKVIEHLRDITPAKTVEAENQQLQEQLRHAQKMESVGTLAGGIAHDFNNLLMGIQGRISLMSLEMSPDDTNLEHLRAIDDYIRGAADLTKQLLGFARGGKYDVKAMDVNDLVCSSAAMFGRTRKELLVRTRTHAAPLIVEADRRQIENVLLNLYINAWQAMANGGELFLATDRVMLDEAYCRAHRVAPGAYARVSVTDNGSGMSATVLQQIFDPFFTTKEKSRGTGLGLASAYGIVSNHGGFFTVYSEVGRGSTFNVFLPLSEKAVEADVSLACGLVSGSETILLVDDEQMIIDVGQAMLKRLGYRVLTAKSGEAALDQIVRMGSQIDLVILDMIMPGLDGGQTFDRIRKIHPQMPVMLSSGYAINGQAETIMRRGCNGFIQKPFSVFQISEKIRQVLQDAAL